MSQSKYYLSVLVLIILILLVSLISIVVGQYDITVSESIYALFGIGSSSDVNIIQNVRLPRIVIGLVAGATLSLSGLFISSALKNPLADSGVLGIQAGASTFGLIIILVFPAMYFMLPLFAFLGGMLAFMITILVSYKGGFSSLNLVLSGVAVNAFFSAIIGILTIFNVNELQGALTYLNGSLANTTSEEMIVILGYGLILIIMSFLFIPILKIIRLDDQIIFNLGKNPIKYRMIIAIYGVLLASLTVSFIGVISFIGIIIPSVSRMIIGDDIKQNMVVSMMLGGLLLITTDLVQRFVFNPQEIPVGLVIGLLCAPLFLIVMEKEMK